MEKTEIAFYDRWGKICTPKDVDVIRDRKGAFAIAFAHNALLLIWEEHAPEVPALPGGGIDEGESEWLAMAREFQEETGLSLTCAERKPSLSQYTGFYADDVNEYWRYNQTYFVLQGPEIDALYFSGERTSPENGKMRWVNVSDIGSLIIRHHHFLAIQHCILDLKAGPRPSPG